MVPEPGSAFLLLAAAAAGAGAGPLSPGSPVAWTWGWGELPHKTHKLRPKSGVGAAETTGAPALELSAPARASQHGLSPSRSRLSPIRRICTVMAASVAMAVARAGAAAVAALGVPTAQVVFSVARAAVVSKRQDLAQLRALLATAMLASPDVDALRKKFGFPGMRRDVQSFFFSVSKSFYVVINVKACFICCHIKTSNSSAFELLHQLNSLHALLRTKMTECTQDQPCFHAVFLDCCCGCFFYNIYDLKWCKPLL